MSRNLMARLAVAAFAIPIILWVCYQGGIWLGAMVTIFAAIATIEFLLGEGWKLTDWLFWFTLIVILGLVTEGTGLLSIWLDTSATLALFGHSWPLLLLGILFLLSGIVLAVRSDPPAELANSHARLTWCAVYIGLLYPFVYRLGMHPAYLGGGDALLFLFGILWVGDTAAMGIGAWIGQRKLAPTVSPNKTVAGFVGGVGGALAVGLLMAYFKFPDISFWHVLIIAVGCSVFGQLGDLVESMWKRSLGIKDSSALIPGHGGILDRFDSLLFAAPFMYWYVCLII